MCVMSVWENVPPRWCMFLPSFSSSLCRSRCPFFQVWPLTDVELSMFWSFYASMAVICLRVGFRIGRNRRCCSASTTFLPNVGGRETHFDYFSVLLLSLPFPLLNGSCILILSLVVRSLLGKFCVGLLAAMFCRGLTMEYWLQGGPLTMIINGSDILLIFLLSLIGLTICMDIFMQGVVLSRIGR